MWVISSMEIEDLLMLKWWQIKLANPNYVFLIFFFTKSERTLENIETIMNFMFNLYEPGCIEVAFFNFKRL